MLDQCHNIEPKIQGQIRSVLNVLEALANGAGDLRRCGSTAGGRRPGANAVLMDAYNTDVRAVPRICARARPAARPDRRLPASGIEQIAAERIGGEQAGWGA